MGLFCSSSCHLAALPKSDCLANFKFLDYSILTNECKGPTYSPHICASTMFSYTNLYGKYPPGLFSSEKREGKEGLACPASLPLASANSTISPPHAPPHCKKCIDVPSAHRAVSSNCSSSNCSSVNMVV